MVGLKFFVNTTKPITKFKTHIYDISLKCKPKPLLRPFMNTGPWLSGQFHVAMCLVDAGNHS